MSERSVSDIRPAKRKRRAVLSCNDCRRRKLKCDRELPCDRCIRDGVTKTCAYGEVVQAPATGSQQVKNPAEDLVQDGQYLSFIHKTDDFSETIAAPSQLEIRQREDIDRLERQVASLQAQLSSLSAVGGQVSAQTLPQLVDQDVKEEFGPLHGLFKGAGYRTFAYGASCTITIVVHFPDLRPFMKNVYPGSSLSRVQAEISGMEDRARSHQMMNGAVSIPTLRSLLPDRSTVDGLVKCYLNTMETTYRILHIPSFMESYEKMWDSESEPNSDTIALVLAILACTVTVSTHEKTRYNIKGSTFRSHAIFWLKACESWLKIQSNKHRTLASIQVRCLRLLALQSASIKTKEYYQEVQSHMGFMRAIGMHRDPSILKSRCSPFECEMRRRLWATSVELEMQASIDRGSPSVLTSLEYDCASPRNINDSDIHAEMDQIPVSQPPSIFTDSSFLHHSMQTVSLRRDICALVNRIHAVADFPTIMQYENQIHKALDQLPHWSDRKALQARTHLHLQLKQLLVVLHTSRVLQMQFRMSPEHRYSLVNCLDSAVALIEQQTTLTESGNFVLCCMRSDYYRAALIICHIAYHACRDSDTVIMRLSQSIFEDTMEKALNLQEQRALHSGRGIHQLWYMSAAFSLVQIKFEPEKEEELKRKAVDRVSRVLYEMLSMQDALTKEDMADEVILGREPDPVLTTEGVRNVGNSISASLPFSNSLMDFGNIDFAESTNEWMLDDFMFQNEFPVFGLP